ncbi:MULTISPECIES: DUF3718 domain-containing protein [Shewanella]|jgi:hypothetical protein|uniref:DUF3718 domain-containing protein n=1 Tax=Shewanella psychromarinicola TaxID=2487742 RepID=A0A3N4E828_9GAMM|nr:MULTISPECIES: DUF3718 domain-containing protein [Shewanella]AZG35124.1 DUF3718 domain-containing protein [Shewanella psychromarinicola]MCL1083633.1 DUF3718 domain-containing protein [Shewanella psychromarinicola]PKG80162.1 hypothetical protein CXF80_18720 [Shewanella sp. Actino-trap-3]RPA33078.1 DUF3718 domain-containing protein [Shewanella psychromarinicola]|tara:strand:+ start:84918 stop:85304 length:387 start_codon:yes stop_codon:yes gene_type:complete
MRLLPVAIAALIAASSVSAPVIADTDQLVANICNYVQSDDKNRLRKKMKENRVKLRNVYSSISCDGSSLLRTAYKSNADDTGEYIAKRMPTSDLAAPEADGKTILDWAAENGHSASAISAAIKERIGG